MGPYPQPATRLEPELLPATPPPFAPGAGVIIVAMYSAAPALDRNRQQEEEALVAAYTTAE